MENIASQKDNNNGANSHTPIQIDGLVAFDDVAAFSKVVEIATEQSLDIESILGVDTNFVQASSSYLLLNVKEYAIEQPVTNLLFLTEKKAYIYPRMVPTAESMEPFNEILSKPFGLSTALCFIIFDKVLESHKQQLESFIKRIKQLEDKFDHVEYRILSLEFERLSDKMEEFHDLLLRLQESYYKQVNTQLIAFDYRVLIAESLGVQARCRRRGESLKQLRQDHEMQATEELNQRIVRLNDVVKRLTALTVILMLPTLIASHFGMNFHYMPELDVWWAYPAVIVFQLFFIGAGFWLFKRIGWL